MCGIAFLLGSSPGDEATIDSFLGALRKRGPDATGRQTIQLEVLGTAPNVDLFAVWSVSWRFLAILDLGLACLRSYRVDVGAQGAQCIVVVQTNSVISPTYTTTSVSPNECQCTAHLLDACIHRDDETKNHQF